MQELNPKTAIEAPENPKNPLNENVNVNANEKGNDYVKDTFDDKGNAYGNEKVEEDVDVKEKDNVKEKGDDEKKSFFDSLILDDFDDEEEYSTCEEGSISDYMQRQFLEEEERKYRYSQSLEEERDTYV